VVLKEVAMADFGDAANESEKRGRSQATATRRRLTD
jgi:hypothetical protein